MDLKVGDEVWIPCEVKPGPFSDERMVLVEGGDQGPWIGFVNVSALRDAHGRTFVRAKVSEVGPTSFSARLPGHSAVGHRFHAPRDKVTAGGPF